MSLAIRLKDTSSEEEYRKANRLAWELGMWLPTDVYQSLGGAIAKPDKEINPLSVVVAVRKILLSSTAGNLNQEDIIVHGPNIGKKSS